MKGSSRFVGRRHELAALQGELELLRTTGEGRFAWIYGRRRVGKSRLVEAFTQRSGVACLFFQAPRRPHPDAIDRFLHAIERSSLPAARLVSDGARAQTWPSALELASRDLTPARPGVIVIDELPYLLELDAGVAADIQEAWDRHLSHRAVMLVCVGSDMRMMQALTAHPAELYCRPTHEMNVRPFTPRDVGALAQCAATEAFDRHLIVGGLPQLARSWPPATEMGAFLERTLCDPASPLVVDGLRMLEAELPRELQARDVLEAIGHGERTFTSIARESGVGNHSTLTNALKTLERKGLIEGELPFPIRSRSNRRYLVADPYLRFWLRFVGPSLDEIDRGRGDLVRARIERDWRTFSGVAIEPIVRRSIERLLPAGRLGGARCVGGYWTRSGSVEVDLVGVPDLRAPEVSFVGSVKWREERPFSVRDARQLTAHRAQVPDAEDALLVGVSRSGFEAGVGLDARLSAKDLLCAWPEP